MRETLTTFKGFDIASEIRRGLEKESLRVTKEGHIANTPHPKKLGSALAHPWITTDYSEALLEFVTPVSSDPHALLQFLEELHIYTLQHMDDEVLWTNSMPCLLKKDENIPIAQYGTSNVGKMKTTYRHGLLHRYGSAMQAIAGIHFNFSLSDKFFEHLKNGNNDSRELQTFKSDRYMNAARNIHKYSWLVPFLFGSSPAICRSFLNKSPHEYDLEKFDDVGTLYYEGATSLRLSDLGYTNSKQNKIEISYNDIDSYAKGLRKAITTPEPDYEKIGVVVDGEYKQLNTNLLQIENEYYSGIRPKRVAQSGESPTNALLRRGVEYLELRSVDLNAFSPIGIELDQIYFLDIFILFCLLEDNEGLCKERTTRFRANQELVARHGRQKNLTLFNGEENVSALEWAKEIFEKFAAIAEHLDQENKSENYTRAVSRFKKTLENSQDLYSERMLREMKEKGETFFRYTMNKSLAYSEQLKKKNLSAEISSKLHHAATESLHKQEQIENSDSISFEEYLAKYFAQNN